MLLIFYFRTKQQKEDEINVHSNLIDRQYLRFIADNLLAYTIIFQQLLPRFLRIDLTSPKEAVLIYRVTKVCNIAIVRSKKNL